MKYTDRLSLENEVETLKLQYYKLKYLRDIENLKVDIEALGIDASI